jgi:hypothetical protein
MQKFLLSLFALALLTAPVHAQVASGRVTTAAPSYTDSTNAPLSLDTSGALRVTSSGGGGTQDVNITGVNGAAPSATNPVWVSPATASTPWTVNGTVAATQSGTWTVQQGGSPWAVTVSGTATVSGTVGVTQSTSPWVTQDNSNGATASAAPARATYVGANSDGNLTGLIQASASAAINVSTATTTQLVALSASKKIYVTSFDVIAGGTGNITFVYGTGTNCGTGTTALTGAYPLTAQAGIAKGNGLGPVLTVPISNALCVTTSAAVQMSGSVAYTQF